VSVRGGYSANSEYKGSGGELVFCQCQCAGVDPMSQRQRARVDPMSQRQRARVDPMSQRQRPGVDPMSQRQRPGVDPMSQRQRARVDPMSQRQRARVDPMSQRQRARVDPMSQRRCATVGDATCAGGDVVKESTPRRDSNVRYLAKRPLCCLCGMRWHGVCPGSARCYLVRIVSFLYSLRLLSPERSELTPE